MMDTWKMSSCWRASRTYERVPRAPSAVLGAVRLVVRRRSLGARASRAPRRGDRAAHNRGRTRSALPDPLRGRHLPAVRSITLLLSRSADRDHGGRADSHFRRRLWIRDRGHAHAIPDDAVTGYDDTGSRPRGARAVYRVASLVRVLARCNRAGRRERAGDRTVRTRTAPARAHDVRSCADVSSNHG